MIPGILSSASSQALGLFLAVLTPTIAFTSINTPFFTNRQIRNAIILAGVCGVALAFSFSLLAGVASPALSPLAARLLAGGLLVALLLMLNERLFTELFPAPRLRRAVQAGGAVFLFGLAAFSFVPINILLLGYLTLSCCDLFRHFHDRKTPVYTDVVWRKQTRSVSDDPPILFTSKPNVYLFYLESVHSEKALRILYGSDAGKETRLSLEAAGYTVYPEANSTMDWTILSRISVLECRIPWTFEDRHMIRDAFVLRTFRENGYKINLFDVDASPYVFGDYAEQADFCSFELPRRVLFLFRLCAPLFAQTRWLRGLANGIDPGETKTMGKDTYFQMLENHIRQAAGKAPHFSVIRFGAPHTNFYRSTWEVPEDWKQYYCAGYSLAMDQLRQLITTINAEDPDAAVIVIGDHGAHSLDDAWIHGAVPGEGLRKHHIDPATLYLDLFSVLAAVKWPKSGEPEGFDAVHSNMFLWLFMALSGDRSLLNFLHPNICLLSHQFRALYLAAENRHPLPEPAPCSHNPAMLKYQTNSVEELYAHDAAYFELALQNLREMEQTPEVVARILHYLRVVRQRFPARADSRLPELEIVRARLPPAEAAPHCARLFAETGREEAWKGWFDALKDLGDSEAALACLEEGRRRKLFSGAGYRHKKAQLYYEFSCWDKAEALCVPLVEQSPLEYSHAKLLYAITYATGRPDEALAILLRFQHRLAESGGTFNFEADLLKNIGLMAVRTGNWLLAEKTFRTLRPLRGTTCWLIMFEAHALSKLNRLPEAVRLVLQELRKLMADELLIFLGVLAIRHKLIGKDFDEVRALALEKLVARKERLAASGLFDAAWYAKNVIAASGREADAALHHFLYQGVFEGKNPNPCFDVMYYLSRYDDIFESGSNPLEHFITAGAAFYRWPSPHFSTIRYVQGQPRLKETGENPLAHALRERQQHPEHS